MHFRKMTLMMWKTDWGRGGKEQDQRQTDRRRQLQKFRCDKTAEPISAISQWEGSKGETVLVSKRLPLHALCGPCLDPDSNQPTVKRKVERQSIR